MYKRRVYFVICLTLFLCLWSLKANAAFITSEQALLIAENWLTLSQGNMVENLGKNIREIKYYFGEEYGYPGYYLVFLDPKGWILIAADDRLEAIRAFGESSLTSEEYERSSGRFLFSIFLNPHNERTLRTTNITSETVSSLKKER